MKKDSTIIRILMVAMITLMAASVGNSQEDKTPAPIFNSASKIAIMPFLKGKYNTKVDEPLDKLLTCTIGELCFFSDDVRLGAEQNLTNYTQAALAKILGNQLLPIDVVEGAISKITPYPPPEATPKSLAMETGKSVDADLVLTGAVWRYKNRVSPEQPASVAFVVYLLDVSTGNIVWKDRFIRSQTALTDDISNAAMFFKGGMKWLTADEMARYGVDLVFKKFPFSSK